GPTHHRLRPVAHRPPEELRPVEQRLDDVGHAAPAHQPDEHELQPLRQAVTVFDGAETHRRYSRVPPLRVAERGTGGEDHVERGTGGEAPNPSPRSETERGSPRRAASPRSSRPRAAPSAAETVTSKRASSEWPARCNAPRSSSVTV